MKIVKNNKKITLKESLVDYYNKNDVQICFSDLNEKDWLNLRKKYITSTNIISLFYLCRYHTYIKMHEEKHTYIEERMLEYVNVVEKAKTMTVQQLAQNFDITKEEAAFVKRHIPQAWKLFVVQAVALGKKHELDVLKMAAEELSLGFEESQDLYSLEKHRISCTPDALTSDGNLIEAKCQGDHKIGKWDEQVPFNYLLQAYVQMFITGRDVNYLSIIFYNGWPEFNFERVKEEPEFEDLHTKVDLPEITPFQFRIYKIKRNEDFENLLVDSLKKFWYGDTSIKYNKEELIELLNKNVSKIVDKRLGKYKMSKINVQIMKQNALNLSNGDIEKAKSLIKEYVILLEGQESNRQYFMTILNIGKAWKKTSNINLTEFQLFMLYKISLVDKPNITLNIMNVITEKYNIDSLEEMSKRFDEVNSIYCVCGFCEDNSIQVMSMGKVWAKTKDDNLGLFLNNTLEFINE